MSGALRYLLWVATGLIMSLLAGASFAIVVDPYFVFDTPILPGLNTRHPYANNQTIVAHSHLAERMRPRTLLLGNSRIEAGFDPDSSVWPQDMAPVFDGALPGRDLKDARRVMEAALSGQRLRTVIIGAEFLDTIGAERLNVPLPPILQPVPALVRSREEVHDWLIASLTTGALVDSFWTVVSQYSNVVTVTRRNGSADLGEYADYVRQGGGAALFDLKLAEYRARFTARSPPDFHHPDINATFGAIMAVLDAAHTAGGSANIIIYPYHASMLELFEALGLWSSFEDFKRVLVRLVWARYPGTLIVDFSGYNIFTAEARPRNRADLAMQWYWEPGHFRTSLGDRMIARLFRNSTDFGRALRPDTVEAVIDAIRRERDTFHAGQRDAL
jgi:hypothetical protein